MARSAILVVFPECRAEFSVEQEVFVCSVYVFEIEKNESFFHLSCKI